MFQRDLRKFQSPYGLLPFPQVAGPVIFALAGGKKVYQYGYKWY
jgi:hypothetical protein